MKNLFRCLLACCFLAAGVFAQPELDVAFGTGGKSIISPAALASASDIAIQSDNKIVLLSAGCSSFSLGQFPICAIRLNENGSFDGDFKNIVGGGPFGLGILTRPTGAGLASGLAIQADGKIVVTGYATGGTENVLLVRYNSDGSFDTGFGTGGILVADIDPAGNDRALKAVGQPDGKLLVIGYAGDAQFVARYLSDGTLDSSFGTGGVVKTAIPGSFTKGRTIALQSDGKIVTGGIALSSPNSHVIARFNPDGSLDTTWDGDGILTIPYTGSSDLGIHSIAAQLDGHVVALGAQNTIYRFNSDGSLDQNFDGDGSRPVFNGIGVANGIAISASGRITAVGMSTPPPCTLPFPFSCPSLDYRFLTARFKTDGSPDTTFSDDGYLDIRPGGANGARAVAIDTLGRTVVAGVTSDCCVRTYWESPKYSSVRFVPPSGGEAVNLSGRVTRSDGNPVGGAILILQGERTTMTALTSPFGFYSFPNVPSGELYTISPGSKKVMFTDQNIFVDGDIAGFNITSESLADTGSRSPVKIGLLPNAFIK